MIAVIFPGHCHAASVLLHISASVVARKVTHIPLPSDRAARGLRLAHSSKWGVDDAMILLLTCIFPAFGRRAGRPRRGKKSRREPSAAGGRAPLTQAASLRQGARCRDDVAMCTPSRERGRAVMAKSDFSGPGPAGIHRDDLAAGKCAMEIYHDNGGRLSAQVTVLLGTGAAV
jgi:hypothetical protein